jgi:uncharacterized membrane protein YecN with MAPEG domain
MPPWTTLVTVLLVIEYHAFVIPIIVERRRTKISPPAMTGDPRLERAIRVHLNTLEKLAFVLPTLWIAALIIGDVPAAAAGGAWGLTRVVYAIGYIRGAKGRALGAISGDVAEFALEIMALWGAVSLVWPAG